MRLFKTLLRSESKAVACLPPHGLINSHGHKMFCITPHEKGLAKDDNAKQVSQYTQDRVETL